VRANSLIWLCTAPGSFFRRSSADGGVPGFRVSDRYARDHALGNRLRGFRHGGFVHCRQRERRFEVAGYFEGEELAQESVEID